MPKLKDRTGERYGKLTVVERADNYKSPCGHDLVAWLCRCDCGNYVVVTGCNLETGHSRSCGCIEKERPNATKHGLMRENKRLYTAWISMKQRCRDPHHKSYKNYGGRGIKVCEEWLTDYEAFYKWAMENGYQDDLTIDRIDNDGDYEPSNCRWTTCLIQRHNQRRLCDWETLIT